MTRRRALPHYISYLFRPSKQRVASSALCFFPPGVIFFFWICLRSGSRSICSDAGQGFTLAGQQAVRFSRRLLEIDGIHICSGVNRIIFLSGILIRRAHPGPRSTTNWRPCRHPDSSISPQPTPPTGAVGEFSYLLSDRREAWKQGIFGRNIRMHLQTLMQRIPI